MRIRSTLAPLICLLGACTGASPPVHQSDEPEILSQWSTEAGVGAGGYGGMVGSYTGGMAWGGMGGVEAAGWGGMSPPAATTVCEATRDGVWVHCWPAGLSVCGPNECEMEYACAPEGTVTDDGCCSCEAGGVRRCLNSAWCPSAQLIGKRCKSEDDCSFPGTRSGLSCHRSFPAPEDTSRVCTRPCDDQCPLTTVCVAVPDEDEPMIPRTVCLRPCASQADCDTVVGGAALGSVCGWMSPIIAPASSSYCL